MDAVISYWATVDDPFFEAGHYVEEWELKRVRQLSAPVTTLLREQAGQGNKIRLICDGLVQLASPLSAEHVLNLPVGLAFCCPLQEKPIGHYDGDEDGAVVCLETGTRVCPTVFEVEWRL